MFLKGKLSVVNLVKAVEFIKSCQNFDGGFGSRPGAESHGGLIYCCVGALSIVGMYIKNVLFYGCYLYNI